MKKLIAIIMLFTMFVFTTTYAQIPPMRAISDLDYMKNNYYKGENYTYKNIQVGSIVSGKVMSSSGHSNPNTDVYQLTIVNSGMVTIEATILNRQYYPSLVIGSPVFVSDVSGVKKYYLSDQKNSIAIEHYNGSGNYLRSIYLDPGTYYFTVSGRQYTQDSSATNYLDFVEYQMTVKSQPYSQELNNDTDTSNPYVFSQPYETVKGSVNMKLLYSPSTDLYRTESQDRFMIPVGNERDVKITVSNTNSNPLNIFKKEIETIRNKNSKNPTTKTITNNYRKEAPLKFSVQEYGQLVLMPGETKEIIAQIKANEDYYVDVMAVEPSEYTITYEEMNGNGNYMGSPTGSDPITNSQGSNKTVNVIDRGIIMLHTACEIPPEVFDNHNYKIYIDGIDYTNNQGYMGHITNLPICNVGDVFKVIVEVDGYEPYEQIIQIPASENNDGSSIVFINVDTNKITGKSDEKIKYYVDGYEVVQGANYDGNLAMAQFGLVMSGGKHTNGRVVNGRRDGNMVLTVDKFFLCNKTIKSSYTVYGTDYGAYTGLGVHNVIGGKQVTTHHSWNGTPVVANGTTLYKTITLTNTTYNLKITKGNYYGMSGSTLVVEQSGQLSAEAMEALKAPQSIYFAFTDNYGNENNYMVVHELKFEEKK